MLKLRQFRVGESMTAYLMLLPNLILMCLFLFWPIVYAFYVSLHDWSGLGSMHYIGFDNYIKIWGEQDFWQSLWISAKYSLAYVPSVFVLALLLALLVKSINGFPQKLFRTVYFLPYSISLVAGSLVWTFMYDPTRGYFNRILTLLGLPPQDFLVSMDQALYSVTVLGLWHIVGFNMIIFLASLKDIPTSYYEAAKMDGASSMRMFFTITFPLLRNTNVFILIVTIIGSLQVFDQIKIMTEGGPANSTNVTVLYIYNQAFQINQIGYSTSVAFVLFFIIMTLTLIQLKVTSGNE
ncbi:MAG: sugar ABC transporter permease [Paenibacillaceae bacterium]